MESFEALRRAVAGDAVPVAKRLGMSSSLVHKWCEPHADFTESGTRNPLDRLEIVMETALRSGRSPRDAFAPIFFLADSFGGLFLPPVPRTIETNDYSRQLCRSILREIYEAIAELSALAGMVEGGK